MKKLLLTLAFSMTTFVFFAQTNYYVDATTGNDDNDGTSPAQAWKSVNAHAATWGAVDCILNIAEGEYIVNTKMFLVANIEVVGAGKDKVILMGATDDDFEEDRHGNKPFTASGFFDISGGEKTVTIKNLTMKNLRLGDGATMVWGGFITVQPSATLKLNSVDILKGELPLGGGAGIDCKGNLDLTNVTIADCIASTQGVAVSFNGNSTGKFESCTFENNTGASTIHSYLAEVADGVAGDYKFNNCYFADNDYSAVQYGACIFLGNFYGKKLNYHITNSAFSGNKGNSAGVLFITTSAAKTREIDMLVSNTTFTRNIMTGGNHGAIYMMNEGANSNISGAISFVNNTFYRNDRAEGSTLGSSDIFFQDMSVDLNMINNIFLTSPGSWGTVFNYSPDAASNCNPTIKGNIFERVGGDKSVLTELALDASQNTKVGQDADAEKELEYIDGNIAVKLATTLTFQNGYNAPFLPLLDGSLAIDGGTKDNSLVPALDVRGQAIVNERKDIGAYEYTDGGATIIEDATDGDILKAYVNKADDTVTFNKEVKTVNVYSINGALIKTVANNSAIQIADLQNGVYVLKATEANGTVSAVKIQK